MARYTINPRDSFIAPIINATFPNYRRRKAMLVTDGSVTFHDLNWSGGTRSEYKACMLDGSNAKSSPHINQMDPWLNPYEGVTASIPLGACVVSHGTFMGKPGMLYIYVNHVDTAPWRATMRLSIF